MTALGLTAIAFIVFVVAWFVLNHFRVVYYDSAMEAATSETSPYWKIIRIQGLLEWPIWTLACLVGLLAVIEMAARIAQSLRG